MEFNSFEEKFGLAASCISTLEIFFVNSIGLPFNSGSIIAGIILIAVFYFSIKLTRQRGFKHLNTGVLCIAFLLL